MEKILVSGIETIVGANLAAALSDRFTVMGLPLSQAIVVSGCEIIDPPRDAKVVRQLVEAFRPDWIIACGCAPSAALNGDVRMALLAEHGNWLAAAADSAGSSAGSRHAGVRSARRDVLRGGGRARRPAVRPLARVAGHGVFTRHCPRRRHAHDDGTRRTASGRPRA